MILTAVAKTPMTPGQVARTYRIPIVDCWRRVRQLQEMGLLRLVMINATPDGRTLRYFLATVPSEKFMRVAAMA